jgi:hypothetical protein
LVKTVTGALLDTLAGNTELGRMQTKLLKLGIILKLLVNLDEDQLWQSPLTASGESRIIHLP